MVIESISLEDFFIEKTRSLSNREDTKAYIISTFMKYKNSTAADFSKDALILKYTQAKFNYSFETFQNIGDWVLFIKSLYPTALNDCSEEYYYSIAQSSYYKCYKLINKTWVLFEELADRLPNIITQLHAEIQESSKKKEDSPSILL